MRNIARVCHLRSLTGALDHRLQHPVALVPSPPERQRLVLIEELLQIGGRGGMGGAEVEGAEAGVGLCRQRALSNDPAVRVRLLVSLSPWSIAPRAC